MQEIEIIKIDNDIRVYYVTASDFPDGILEAHQSLHSSIHYTDQRRYFGISRPENHTIVYRAAAEVLAEDEAEGKALETMIIKKGSYSCIDLPNYTEDFEGIGSAFQRLITLPDIDPQGYCIEWYLNDKDVKCMIRMEEGPQE